MRAIRTCVVALALGMVSAPALHAAETGATEPLQLSADHGELDNAEGVSTYTGNVVVTRGSMRITGDELRVYRGDDGGVARIEVEGDPATYRDEASASGAVDAQAPRMTYHASAPERLHLEGGAQLQRGRDEFRGETLLYHIAGDRIEADRGDDGQRVEIKLYPENGDGGGGQ
ncbi:lipopolysaccharide transport periplasmic protein LptA [Arhodomonas sp. AD133]|uniref:lipopolysaccharide transport periplasmic protein LptA n=1 Tax=Arhodomonas sp. AD133 TaxID=3415009 RepID=UPI003EBB0E81